MAISPITSTQITKILARVIPKLTIAQSLPKVTLITNQTKLQVNTSKTTSIVSIENITNINTTCPKAILTANQRIIDITILQAILTTN
jgi:hypothetical protein